MKNLVRLWRRTVARLLVLALAVGAAPVNLLAGEPPGPPPAAPRLAVSIEKAVHELGKVEKLAPKAAARPAGAQAQSTSGNFFKSKAGMFTLVLLAAGTGLALYSTSHDRVRTENVPYGGTWK